jgi:transposase
MTLSHLLDNTFVGIDVGGAGLDVAWHRGDLRNGRYRPDAIATLVERLRTGPQLTRIVLEPTGGYGKPLVKALRQAQLPVEIIHTTRFTAYRALVGAKAKSDTSDARLLASYAAAPDEVRGRKVGHVELPNDAIREELSELASRRDQLKQMIHAETCRIGTVRMAELRQMITVHLEALRAEDKQVHRMMLELVRQRIDLRRDQRLLKTIKGRREVCAELACLGPRTRPDRQQGGSSPHRGRSLRPPKRHHDRSGANPRRASSRAQHPLHGGSHCQQAQSSSPSLLRKAHREGKTAKDRHHRRAATSRRLRQCRAKIRPALERRYCLLTANTVDPGSRSAWPGRQRCCSLAGYTGGLTTVSPRPRLRSRRKM